MAILGVDVGGTFTDAVLVHNNRSFTAKTPTTPRDQSIAVIDVTEEVLDKAKLEATEVGHFAHGMTVATNALLELRGARTGMLTTKGFKDIVEIGRQVRPELYRLCIQKPKPLIPPERIFEVVERVTPNGIEQALDESTVREACKRLKDADVDSVAVCFLFSYKTPEHEQRAVDLVREYLPDVHVSASHDVVSQFREFERFSTTCIDAYLSPLLATYLERLNTKTSQLGLPSPMIMQSNGGLMSAAEAAAHGSAAVLSGPAGGAVCSAYFGSLSGYSDLITVDMGGTSCDVSVVQDESVRQTSHRNLEGRPLQLPMLDINTVGAGGGSIAWCDPGGALRVGPHSAGADPGPACYDRGGTDPTVTDANLLLGYLSESSTLAGGVNLKPEASRDTVGALAHDLNLSPIDCATGIVRVANHEMLRPLRVMTVERGLDPRRFSLLGFGGAGPMHAASLADELDIDRVICPRASGVLSALGLAVSDQRRDLAQSVLLAQDELTSQRIADSVRLLANRACRHIHDAEIETSYDIRYRGQSFELNIPGPPDPDPELLRERFEEQHESWYGYTDPEAILELVTIRVAAISHGHRSAVVGTQPGVEAKRSSRPANFDGSWLDTAILSGEPESGAEVEGPAIFELPEATVVVPPKWEASVDDLGTVSLERKNG